MSRATSRGHYEHNDRYRFLRIIRTRQYPNIHVHHLFRQHLSTTHKRYLIKYAINVKINMNLRYEARLQPMTFLSKAS